MKICYICADYGIPVMGRKGCSTHVRETCRALQQAGHEVFILSPNPGEDRSGNQDIEIIEIPPFRGKWMGSDMRYYLYNLRLKKAFNQIFKERKPDVIYERYSLYATAGLEISKQYNLPRILEINSFLVHEQKKRLHFPQKALRVENKLILSAEFIIVVSDPLRQAFIDLGVKEEDITIMPMAVDVKTFHPGVEPNDLRERLGVEKGKTLVGYVGTLTGWHGIDMLYEIGKIIQNKNLPIEIAVIGGDKRKVENHRQKAKENKMDHILHFIGSVSYSEVPNYISSLDVTLISGSHEWASPTKLFEYQAMGKPSIAPRFIPVEEAMTHRKEGFLFNDKNASQVVEQIMELHDDPEMGKEMGKLAREKVIRTHSWECNTDRIIEVFDSMLANRNGNRH